MPAIILPRVRLAFFDGWQARPDSKGNNPKFGGNFIFEKGSEAYKRAEAEFLRAAQAEYGANWMTILGAMESSKKCLRDGNKNLTKDGEIRNGFKDHFYIVAKNKSRPAIVAHRFFAPGVYVHIAEDGSPVVNGQVVTGLPFEVKKPYGGCYVNAKVEIGAMKAKGEVSANVFARLLAVQFVDDGEAFGAGPGTADGFEDMGGDYGEAAAQPVAGAANLFG